MISIIVPVYKVEEYLNCCVESLLSQTYSDIELILVDDGSPDRCPEICDKYAEKDSRVRVIHKKNGGVSSARNAGLDAATGEYITFVDSDDWVDPNMYAAMMEKINKYNCDLVFCDCIKEYPVKKLLYSHNIRAGYYDREQIENEYYPHLLMMENLEYPATISNWLLLFRRELVQGLRYVIGVRFSEDLLFGAQLISRADSFFYMKGEAFYHYRMNPASATHTFVPNKWEDYLKLHTQIKDAFGSFANYDFSHQIDMCLIFFLHNTLGGIYDASIKKSEKIAKIREILDCRELREVFRRFEISALPITLKLKVLTYLYRYRIGIRFLVAYFS